MLRGLSGECVDAATAAPSVRTLDLALASLRIGVRAMPQAFSMQLLRMCHSCDVMMLRQHPNGDDSMLRQHPHSDDLMLRQHPHGDKLYQRQHVPVFRHQRA